MNNLVFKKSDTISLTSQQVITNLKRLRRMKDPTKIAALKNDIVMVNVKLIGMVMKPYLKFKSIQPDDMFTEGVMGIYTAIEKFDPDHDTKFSTYAYWWIKQKIQRFVEANCMNRIDQNSVSIDKPIGHDEDGGRTIADTIRVDMPIAGESTTKSIHRPIFLALKDLSPRELFVLHLRYGL